MGYFTRSLSLHYYAFQGRKGRVGPGFGGTGHARVLHLPLLGGCALCVVYCSPGLGELAELKTCFYNFYCFCILTCLVCGLMHVILMWRDVTSDAYHCDMFPSLLWWFSREVIVSVQWVLGDMKEEGDRGITRLFIYMI